jgi:hypothetical protein
VNWEEALSLLGAKALSSKWSLSPPFPEELSAIVRAELEGVEAERERWAKWAILAAEVAPLKARVAELEAAGTRAQGIEEAAKVADADAEYSRGAAAQETEGKWIDVRYRAADAAQNVAYKIRALAQRGEGA